MGNGETRRSDEDRKRRNRDGDDKHEIREDHRNVGRETETKTFVQWAALIRRWSTDYALLSSNRAQTFLAPRGLPSVISVLVADGARYSVTGSMAAETRAPIAPTPLGMIYVDDTAEIAQILQLRPAETAGNLILLEPFDEVVFERTWTNDGVTFAAPSQVAADLLTSPGRGPAEGEELLRWMEANEADWRTA